MAKKPRIRQCVSAVALTALVWTGSVWTTGTAFAATNPFSDVKTGHWAEKHVSKLFLQGIISGKGEGKFDPSGNIRREDAVIVALRFLGLADEIDKNGSIAFPSTFQVDDYAKPYVMEAFKRKILLTNEEYDLANSEKGKSWGQANASREWVARLLVRAIGKEAAATENSGKTTAFSDDGKIEPDLKPYVVTAVNEKLVSGVTTTTFEPKSPINRASLATLFSKAESKVNVAYNGQVTGVLLAIAADKLTVLHEDGSLHDYPMSANTMFARFDSDKPGTLASLKLYGKATLIHGEDGSIAYVEQTDDNTYIKTVDGAFSKVNTTDGKIWLDLGDSIASYDYDKSVAPVVTDANGNAADLKNIPVGTAISLKVDTIRTTGKVVAITIKQSVVNKTGQAVVTAWNPATNALTVSDVSTGASEQLSVSPTATFKQSGVFVTPDVLKVGYTVDYEVKAGVVTSLSFAKPALTTVAAKFLAVDKSNKTIQYYVGSEPMVKLYIDNVKVKIDGMTDASLDDLQKNDDLTLTLDGTDRVSQIAVNGRSVQYLTGVSVAGYLAPTKTLSLYDSANRAYNFILNDNVRYDMNGVRLDAAQAVAQLTAGKKVTLAYSGSNVITVYFVAKYSGTLLENNTTATTKTLKVQVDPANVVSVPYNFPFVEVYGSTTATFADVKAGDLVTVILNANQDQVQTIQVQKTAQLEVASVDVATSKIRFKKAGTTATDDWTVTSSTALQDANGATVPLSQFTAGTLVNATFSGKTSLLKVKAVTTSYGRVVSVNTANASVDISLPNGATVTQNVGTSPLIVRGTATSNALSTLLPDERVWVRQDENDRTVFEVVPALKKEFWQYSAALNAIQVLHSTTTEEYTYPVDAQTYIHQGTTILKPNQFANGDAISIYILKGKVVEVSK